MSDTNRPLTVHQTVHGYRGGHRLMASSTPLSDEAEAIQLTMSDVLTSDPLDSFESYLTGYPLKDVHKFVLARTWGAPESSRRGSVWTHSLLLDYSTLTQLEDVFVLLQLFRRPSLASLAQFEKPVTLQTCRTSDSLPFGSMLASDERVHDVLAGVYGSVARNRIRISSISDPKDEVLALGVWRQMWPSLRRSFSFSTRASAEDLRIGDFGLTFEREESKYGLAEGVSSKDRAGLAYLAKDLPKRGPTRLRRFLGRYAYDAKSPRLIVPSLAAIFAERKDTHDALSSYETLLRDAPGLLRLKQDLLLASARDRANPAALSKSLLLFAHEPAGSSINSLAAAILDAPYIANGEVILHVASESPPGSVGNEIFPVLAHVLPIEMLAKEVPAHEKMRLLHLREDVVQQRSFWSAPEAMRHRLLDEAISLGIPAEELLVGLTGGLTASIARKLIEYDHSSMLPIYQQAASEANNEVLDFLPTWPGFISALSKSRIVVPISMLERFANLVLATDLTLWCTTGETADLISRSSARPTHAQPYLAAVAFSSATLSSDQESRSLFECVFDAVLDSSDRFAIPPACQRLVLAAPALGATQWLPERLFNVALSKYAQGKKVDSRVFCVSSNPHAIARLARHIIRYFGEDELRRIHSELGKLKGLQVPRSVVEKGIEAAMPFFSKPLRKK